MYKLTITPDAFLTVSLEEAKTHLRVDHSAEDAMITGIIAAASDIAESLTGRQIRSATTVLKLKRFPRGRKPIILPRPALRALTSLSYVDANGVTQSLVVGDLQVETGNEPSVSPARGTYWPSVDWETVLPVTITYTNGYALPANVPELIKQAIKLQIGSMYSFREGITEQATSKLAIGFHDLLMPYVVGDEFQDYQPEETCADTSG